MIWSKYNFSFEKEQITYLYNSRTNALISTTEDETKIALDQAKDGNLSMLDPDSLALLKNGKFISSQEDEDSFFYEKKHNYYTSVFSKEILNLTILTTLNCNFKCPYCYEKDTLNTQNLSPEIEKAIIYLAKKFPNINKIKITWYGGEPLLNFDSIKRLTLELEKLKKPIEHNIVTNGYLLDDRMSFFNTRNLESIQITIDGLAETHNKKRILKNNNGTFDRILANIENFIKLNSACKVYIRCNIDESNENEFSQLYHFLNKKFNFEKRLIIYAAFVRNDNGRCNNVFIDSDKEAEFFIRNFKKENIKNLSFKPRLTLGGCGANNLLFFVITPNGDMYKCWNDIGRSDYQIGNILDNGIYLNEITDKYLLGPSIYTDPECKNCSFFPICSGGCSHKRIQNQLHNEKYNLCTYAKNHLEKFLELNYLK
ncbi:radical SAM protein [Labilibaculum euxinus]